MAAGDARTKQTDVKREWVIPFPRPRQEITDATHFRSTWIAASQATLRERGHGPAYDAAIDPAFRAAVLATVAGVWFPMEIAHAHYAACDRLDLPENELIEIGAAALRRAHATTLKFITRMAKGAGITPWTVIESMPRIWTSTADGGAVAIARLGPKDAEVEFVGYPLAGLRYNRITMRGILLGCVEMFCARAYVREVSAGCTERCLVMRVSWA